MTATVAPAMPVRRARHPGRAPRPTRLPRRRPRAIPDGSRRQGRSRRPGSTAGSAERRLSSRFGRRAAAARRCASRRAFDADDVETVNEFEEALNSLDAPLPEVEIGRRAARNRRGLVCRNASDRERSSPRRSSTSRSARTSTSSRSSRSCERARRRSTSAKSGPPGVRRPAFRSMTCWQARSTTARRSIASSKFRWTRQELQKGHQVTIGLRLEDRDKKVLGEEKTFAIELHTRRDIEKLLLSLKFHIFGK